MDEKYKLNLEKIKKYFNKNETLLEFSMLNYSNYSIYIRLDYFKKIKSYKIIWFNLNLIEDNNFEKYANYQYIDDEYIEELKTYLGKIIVSSVYENAVVEDNLVTLNINIKTKNEKSISIKFNKYLPRKLAHLDTIVMFLFRNLPVYFENLLFEMLSILTEDTIKYEYKKEFDFDLFNDNINDIFEHIIIVRGENYFRENRVKFLEKIDEKYFSVVEGSEKYLVVIQYKEKLKKMQVYCSCPCEFYCKHMYAVILSILNSEFNRFYKVTYKNPNKNLLEIIENFNYYLCLGVLEQNLEIVNDYGDIELVPILDKFGKNNWKVLEDSEDEILTKEIIEFMENI